MLAWGSLAGSCGGGVCKLAAFCTGGPVEGSYCCWLCFCPVSCAAWGVGGIPPAKQKDPTELSSGPAAPTSESQGSVPMA